MNQPIPFAKLDEDLGLSLEEGSNVVAALSAKGWAEYHTFGLVRLLIGGIEKVEELMEETYLEQQNRVLKKIYDMRGPRNLVAVPHLVGQLDIHAFNIYNMLTGLEEKGYIEWEGGDIVRMKQAGIEAIEEPEPKAHSINYTMNVQTNYGTIQQGRSNTIINQSLSEILPKLGGFIESIRETDFERRDKVVEELEEIKTLAEGKLSPGIWELIQAKFVSAETAMKVAGVVYKSHPYWPAISDFFNQFWK